MGLDAWEVAHQLQLAAALRGSAEVEEREGASLLVAPRSPSATGRGRGLRELPRKRGIVRGAFSLPLRLSLSLSIAIVHHGAEGWKSLGAKSGLIVAGELEEGERETERERERRACG